MKSYLSFAKVWFIVSFVGLAFLYGSAVGKWEWFPYSFMDRAVDQARALQDKYLTKEKNNLEAFRKVYDRQGARLVKEERKQQGVTAITSWWRTSEGPKVGIKVVDEDGEVWHQWLIDRTQLFGNGYRGGLGRKIHGSIVLPDGDIVLNLEYTGMARLNACGDVLWTLTEGTHHSISQAEDGTFWVPGVSQKKLSKSDQYPNGFPGLNSKKVWVERLLHVSGEGEVLERINVLDILYANGLERYIPKVLGGTRPTPEKIGSDITHLNDVEPLNRALADEYPLFDAGDLVVSLRSLSLVFVFDPETLEVKWHSSDPFIYQHDPDFIGDGWIGVFDNNYDLTSPYSPERGEMLGGNKIVYIRPSTGSLRVPFPTQKSEMMYTNIGGKWQKLDNGNMLLTEYTAGHVREVSPNGETVWEWTHHPTDNSKVPTVSKATRVDLTHEEVASWPCSSVDSIATSARKQQTAP